MHESGNSVKGYWLFLVLQIIFVIIFGAFGRYDKELLPHDVDLAEAADGGEAMVAHVPQSKYPRM